MLVSTEMNYFELKNGQHIEISIFVKRPNKLQILVQFHTNKILARVGTTVSKYYYRPVQAP